MIMKMDDKIRRKVTFSFKKALDIIDANTGDEAFNGDALDAPINCILRRKAIPPKTMPITPDIERSMKSLPETLLFFLGSEMMKRKSAKMGKRIALANKTSIFLNPNVTRIVPMAQHSAAAIAAMTPLKLIFFCPSSSSSNETMAKLITINIAPTKYLGRKVSLRKIIASIIVNNGEVKLIV
jgi:hypothetical protein